jgi:proteasome activator subunit 4
MYTFHTLFKADTEPPEGLSSFLEPCYLVYGIENVVVDQAMQNLRSSLPMIDRDNSLVSRCRDKRIERVHLLQKAAERTVRGHAELLDDS